MSAKRQHRRIEQDERRRSEPGGGQRGGRHRAPAVPDDLEVGARAGGTEERRDVGGVVAESVVALPVAGPAVPGLVDRDDASPGRGERRPDPPPVRRGRRHAVDEQERPGRGSPQASADHGIPPASTASRSPGSAREGERARSTAAGRFAPATSGGPVGPGSDLAAPCSAADGAHRSRTSVPEERVRP